MEFVLLDTIVRPGNIEFEFLDHWERAIAVVARQIPSGPQMKGKRGFLSWFKQTEIGKTYIGGTSLYWDSPRLIVLPYEPIESDRSLWSFECFPNWNAFDWELEVWRVTGLPNDPTVTIDLTEILTAISQLQAASELQIDGLAQLQALVGFNQQGILDLARNQQNLAVAIEAMAEQLDQLALNGFGGNGGGLPPGVV